MRCCLHNLRQPVRFRLGMGRSIMAKDGMATQQTAIAILGFVLPSAMCSQTSACSAAANKDMLHLIHSLRQNLTIAPDVFSVFPIGVYPKSRQIMMGARREKLEGDIYCQLIPFLNVFLLKQVTVGISNLLILMIWLWHNRNHQRYVIVHNVYPPMSVPVLLATRLLGGKSVALVMDLPHDLSYDFSGIKGKLRQLNWWVETHILSYFSGIIAYSRFIGEDHAPSIPMLVMEGGVDIGDICILPDQEIEIGEIPASDDQRILMFSGTLNRTNGVDMLLHAFQRLNDPSYRLWIFGRGPLGSLVNDAAQSDNRIVFFGFVPDQSAVTRVQQQATLLVSLRMHNDLINRYTFPSKIREYMLSGRPVLSTLSPGIPDEYYEHMYILKEESVEGLSQSIHEICSKSADELSSVGANARSFVLTQKNWSQQARRIMDFLCTL